MGSNEDTNYIKVVALNEIYNFVVLSFYICSCYDTRENNTKFQHEYVFEALYYFLEHLNDFKCKNSKLQSCKSH
jgi:hypothetical protein